MKETYTPANWGGYGPGLHRHDEGQLADGLRKVMSGPVGTSDKAQIGHRITKVCSSTMTRRGSKTSWRVRNLMDAERKRVFAIPRY
jgi:hypothetical protein